MNFKQLGPFESLYIQLSQHAVYIHSGSLSNKECLVICSRDVEAELYLI